MLRAGRLASIGARKVAAEPLATIYPRPLRRPSDVRGAAAPLGYRRAATTVVSPCESRVHPLAICARAASNPNDMQTGGVWRVVGAGPRGEFRIGDEATMSDWTTQLQFSLGPTISGQWIDDARLLMTARFVRVAQTDSLPSCRLATSRYAQFREPFDYD